MKCLVRQGISRDLSVNGWLHTVILAECRVEPNPGIGVYGMLCGSAGEEVGDGEWGKQLVRTKNLGGRFRVPRLFY
jgi:hypothetical protein